MLRRCFHGLFLNTAIRKFQILLLVPMFPEVRISGDTLRNEFT